MARQVMHIKKSRSWWDGSVTTLCGLKILDPERIWFPSLSGNVSCPACVAASENGARS
ncbi:hypothetical protein C8D87_11746 [Lentzea atacamensis]|uniref:Uncharacterized protein n=1 Tax=Lentzea atacamensis TaxID=531938 RepID=A0ABX9DY58_9PSEU|nr:hypothetical protein [Lentzea atacamensis]RAS58876.1 hypothetical protein C8D87_11746 [Lentzea atacamensis]